jgi:hypothetical protein
VSNVGKTLLKGHGLRWEGAVVHDSDGYVASSRFSTDQLHAKCACGALSPAGISRYGARKWHREHKQEIRDSAPQSTPVP